MFVLEFKVKAKKAQTQAIDEAIRTTQFIRNKCIRYWMDNQGVNKYALNKLCKQLAEEFSWAKELNSMARQSAAERAWSSISRFYDNCKKGINGKKGYPQFQKNNRSVEYKTSGWKLDLNTRKHITFTDKKGIGRVKLVGTRDLHFYHPDEIKRVRLLRRADGYYCQFLINTEVKEQLEPTKRTIGLDVGLESFYTDSDGHKEPNPRFFREGEQKLKRLQRRLSKKQKGSSNRRKARQKLGKAHLRISRQRKEHALRLARCVVKSNDFIAYENLKVSNMVKNHCLAKSISDVGWYQFRVWLEYFAQKFGKVAVAVPPHYTSQECSNCGRIVKKSLSTRTHACQCGTKLDRDENAAINILREGLRTVGRTGTAGFEPDSKLVERPASTSVVSEQLGQADSSAGNLVSSS
ncbi:transposase [Euhalothece natronophila Z-M001]|uniref:Transposase n=1 Tax=Euhalothece natronophila Z-M001 TaxID=522448 RepID=A0A5B8NM89_9CHRO|nr:RNA-guided endonuclease TnpB family protein [Euhalothece natronophila]QDZ38878.1 transposase [Euhalothece natronophila Z-M001]QDZ39395.1 transposase [Euhalothece natronophila Z-M001]QDZ40052.1 transposase [Euhalothece natronophila Z-M001]